MRIVLGIAALLAFSASAQSVWDLVTTSPRPKKTAHKTSVIERGYRDVENKPVEKVVTVEKPVTSVVEKVVTVEKVVEKPVEKVVTVEKVVEKPVEVEKIVEVEKPVTSVVEKVVTVEKVVEKPVEKVVTVEKVVEKPVEVEKIVEVEKPVTSVVEKVVTVEKVVEKPIEKVVTVEKVVEKPVEVEKIVEVEKPVTSVVEKVVTVEKVVEVEKPVTSVVEKVVYDHALEMKLAKEKAELERRGGALEIRNAGLEKRNDELQRALTEERDRRQRLERTLPKDQKKAAARTGRAAQITSANTYYDRKKGVAYFEGRVHVDDEQYQLHADKAYVFTTGTNELRRIVAVGHVAMTNEQRRAYGGKVSYYRQDGMVVLYADDTCNAEIRDESKSEDQTVRGSKIKFWIDNEQVEVLDATIVAPMESGADIRLTR